jgi:hypothetical protein
MVSLEQCTSAHGRQCQELESCSQHPDVAAPDFFAGLGASRFFFVPQSEGGIGWPMSGPGEPEKTWEGVTRSITAEYDVYLSGAKSVFTSTATTSKNSEK